MKKILFFALITSLLSNQHTYGMSTLTKLQKLEVATALLQMPILLSAATINAETPLSGKNKLKLITSLTRLAHSSLSLYNKNQVSTEGYNCDKYLLAWGAYDLIKLATTVQNLAISTPEDAASPEEATPEETKLQKLLKRFNDPGKIILPMIETGAAFYAASNNGTSLEEQRKRTKAHSIGSLARAASELLESDYASLQQKLFAAVVTINLVSIYRDWFLPEKKDSQAPTLKPAPAKNKNVRWADGNGESLVQKIAPQKNNPAPAPKPAPAKKAKRKKRTTTNIPYTPINEVLKRLNKKDVDYINRGKKQNN